MLRLMEGGVQRKRWFNHFYTFSILWNLSKQRDSGGLGTWKERRRLIPTTVTYYQIICQTLVGNKSKGRQRISLKNQVEGVYEAWTSATGRQRKGYDWKGRSPRRINIVKYRQWVYNFHWRLQHMGETCNPNYRQYKI